MPIVQDPDKRSSIEAESARYESAMQIFSEESIRTEFCDGPVDVPGWNKPEPARDTMACNEGGARTSDRAELMARIKRGESPTWVPKQPIEDYYRNADERPPSPSIHPGESRRIAALLPAAELQGFTQTPINPLEERLSPPIEIQRPRSALHAGDFTTDDSETQRHRPSDSPRVSRPFQSFGPSGPCGTSPTTPWFTPSSSFSEFAVGSQAGPAERGTYPPDERGLRCRPPARCLPPSLNSYSSSYVLKAPTTPLVQQSSNTDVEISTSDFSMNSTKTNRRHTLPLHALHPLQTSPTSLFSAVSHDAYHPSFDRTSTSPYQKHHSRRSLTSNWSLQASTSPQTPGFTRSRKLSYSEASPLHNSSMVGSFEESILRGSMSTAPSKPLDFTAQIGVLGKNNCKPKCPAHVTIPFPAVFYNWGGVGNSRNYIDDEPSPYVGHIDLQSLLSPAERKKSRENRTKPFEVDAEYESTSVDPNLDLDGGAANLNYRKSKKRRRTSSPSQVPLGGSYRIPQQGQLQIIIKNPNKTAVKLFLVPYDLTGMETETKTFIRQRCYSTEPVEKAFFALKSSSNQPIAPDISQPPKRKPTLRYLIHLNICSPSKGRFYLYQHIRVVFANRVPDNKEQLQNEIQIPQPRYSAYKSNHNSLINGSPSTGTRPPAEKAYRRRSSGFGFSVDSLPGIHSTQSYSSESSFPFRGPSLTSPTPPIPPIPPIPFKLAISKHRASSPPPLGANGCLTLDVDELSPLPASSLDDVQSSPLGSSHKHRNFNAVVLSSSYKSSSGSGSDGGYGKLSRGDEGYGGFFGRPGTPEPGEGLLARKLKGLGVKKGEDV